MRRWARQRAKSLLLSACSLCGQCLSRPRQPRTYNLTSSRFITQIAALNFEIARLKRWRFGASSESLDAQAPLFEAIIADTAIEDQAAREGEPTPKARVAGRRAHRQALPAALPRVDHHHELADTRCACGQPLVRIVQDVSEQLDCVPAQFFVHRHIRGKYACKACQTIQAAALPAQIIDKGLPDGPRRGPCRAHAEVLAPVGKSRRLSSIAEDVGFHDAAHFSRVFKEHFGYSPREAGAGLPDHGVESPGSDAAVYFAKLRSLQR